MTIKSLVFTPMIALFLSTGPAAAHSTKEATIPADGATLTASPPEIALRFDMPMRVTMLRLTDAAGAEAPLTREGGMVPAVEVTATPGSLAPGAYTVEWRGLAADGHAMSGRFGFTLE